MPQPGAAGYFHAAFFVDSEALGGDDVAFFDHVFDFFGAAFGEFGDVDESVFTRKHFHESAKLGDGNHLAHLELFEHTANYQRDGAVEALLLRSVSVQQIPDWQMIAEVHHAVKDADDLERLPLNGEEDDVLPMTSRAATFHQIFPQPEGIWVRLDARELFP